MCKSIKDEPINLLQYFLLCAHIILSIPVIIPIVLYQNNMSIYHINTNATHISEVICTLGSLPGNAVPPGPPISMYGHYLYACPPHQILHDQSHIRSLQCVGRDQWAPGIPICSGKGALESLGNLEKLMKIVL